MSAQLYIVRGFLDAPTCRDVREAMDRGVAEAAEVLHDEMSEEQDVRRADMIEIDPEMLARIEQRLDDQLPAVAAFFGLPLTEREGTGFLRYRDGGFYLPHIDWTDDEAWPGAERRSITVVVFLNNEGFTGGVLWVSETDVAPEAGMLVAFPSDVLHEVTPVRGARRDTIIDWYLSPRRRDE